MVVILIFIFTTFIFIRIVVIFITSRVTFRTAFWIGYFFFPFQIWIGLRKAVKTANFGWLICTIIQTWTWRCMQQFFMVFRALLIIADFKRRKTIISNWIFLKGVRLNFMFLQNFRSLRLKFQNVSLEVFLNLNFLKFVYFFFHLFFFIEFLSIKQLFLL